MEIILRDRVPNLGDAGELVKVKPGYARNFLIPNGLAYPATPANKRRWEAEAKSRSARLAGQKAGAEGIADQLSQVELKFTAKTGDGDRLFGSITAKDIAAQLAERGIDVDKRVVELTEPLKMIGIYQVPVRIHPEVAAEVKVIVDKE